MPADRPGVVYTPAPLAELVAAMALDPLLAAGCDAARLRVLDPACGTGNLLVAAGARLAGHVQATTSIPYDEAFAHVARHCLEGIDTDSEAVDRCRAALGLGPGEGHVRAGDAFEVRPEGVDAIVANPPFLTPLRRAQRPSAAEQRRLARAVGLDAAVPYADRAGLFLLLALRAVRPHGRVAIVQPLSVLAGRDAGPIRAAVASLGAVDGFWAADAPVFEAAVRACVLSVERAGSLRPVRRWWGWPPTPVAPAEGIDVSGPTWAALARDLAGIPWVPSPHTPTFGSRADVTADFRDQYYVVARHAGEDTGDGRCPVVTVGAIDPARLRWAERAATIGRRRLLRPVIDRRVLDDRLRARLVPKIVVATQTRALEAVVDSAGAWVPSVPVISATAEPRDLWHLAAAALSPYASAWALQQAFGTGRSFTTMRLRASQLSELPLPRAGQAWDEAAAHVAAAHETSDEGDRRRLLLAAARASSAAYDVTDPEPLIAWWARRLPA